MIPPDRSDTFEPTQAGRASANRSGDNVSERVMAVNQPNVHGLDG